MDDRSKLVTDVLFHLPFMNWSMAVVRQLSGRDLVAAILAVIAQWAPLAIGAECTEHSAT